MFPFLFEACTLALGIVNGKQLSILSLWVACVNTYCIGAIHALRYSLRNVIEKGAQLA